MTTASASATTTATSTSASTGVAIARVQEWASTLQHYALRLEHVAVDISTDRILYHLECELAHLIPRTHLAHCEFLTLGWPLGGIWKILKVDKDNRFLHCLAWRKTELNHEHIEAMDDELQARQRTAVPDPPLTVFGWKMQLGVWRDQRHWFLRDALPPTPVTESTGTDNTSIAAPQPPLGTPVTVHLLAGLAPIEVYLSVNSITSVDTVAQTFTADVTWDVTIPGVTAIREDSVLRELLDMLEFNEDAFEFTNVTSMQEERPITTVLSFAGDVEFYDALAPQTRASAVLSHLTYSRRTIAVFSEEMSLYNFPHDQQKLTFALSLGSGVRPSLGVVPAPVDAGRFALDNFKLGNVFHVVYGNRVFIDYAAVDAAAPKKALTFALMLERRSAYYLTNVALPAASITYLCFATFAPVDDTGALMDTSSRLQIVLTLLLTAVTFKSQVASLIPQVSYFTTLDAYVFVCFVVTCCVTLENALFPTLVQLFPTWREDGLLGFSVGAFTLVNVVWGVYLVLWLRLRSHRANVLLQVEAYVRVVAATVPASHRDVVLREHLAALQFKAWELPTIATIADTGVLYIELPDDSPSKRKRRGADETAHERFRNNAKRDTPAIQALYRKLNPSGAGLAGAPARLSASVELLDHARLATQANRQQQQRSSSSCFVVHMQDDADAVPLRQSVTHYRCHSQS